MKKIILTILVSLITLLSIAQMDIPGDGGNIRATVSEDIGITSVTIKYSRPRMKGREGKICGGVEVTGQEIVNRDPS